jgi:hypothetical protein
MCQGTCFRVHQYLSKAVVSGRRFSGAVSRAFKMPLLGYLILRDSLALEFGNHGIELLESLSHG